MKKKDGNRWNAYLLNELQKSSVNIENFVTIE